MKIKALFVVVGLAATVSSKAQFSIAADMGFPMGDFGDAYGFAVGPGIGYDLPLGDMLAIFGQASYDFLMVKEDFSDVISGAYMAPYQAGLKLNFGGDAQGLHVFALLGGHSIGYKVTILDEETTESSTLFSWGLGVGFRAGGKLDIGLRYNSISEDKDIEDASASTYVGLRVGFVLGGE